MPNSESNSRSLVGFPNVAPVMIENLTLTPSSVDGISVPLSSPDRIGTLEVDLLTGSLTIQGEDVRDVVIRLRPGAGDREEEGMIRPASGMKKLHAVGLYIDIRESDNVIAVHSPSMRATILDISVPRNFNLRLRTINDGEILVRNVNGEIEIENINGGIRLENVSGTVSSNTINGPITAAFRDLNIKSAQSFGTLNGSLDVTFPESTSVNVKLKSDQGEIFSDFDIDNVKSAEPMKAFEAFGGGRFKLENWVRGSINGGGPEIMMESINGDVYLRKKKPGRE